MDVSHIIIIVIIIIICWALQFARYLIEITSFHPHKSPMNWRLILSHHTEAVHVAQKDEVCFPGSHIYTVAEPECSPRWSSSWDFALTSASHIKTPFSVFRNELAIWKLFLKIQRMLFQRVPRASWSTWICNVSYISGCFFKCLLYFNLQAQEANIKSFQTILVRL